MIRVSIYLILFTLTVFPVHAQEIQAYMSYDTYGINNGKEVEGAVHSIGIELANALEDVYPCMIITSERDLYAMLERERQKALVGSGNEIGLETIGGSLTGQYLINVSMGVFTNNVVIKAMFMDKKVVKTIAQSVASTTISNWPNVTNDLISKLLKQLEYYEVCPFKGQVELDVESIVDTVKKEEYSVYCNEFEYQYKKEDTQIDKSKSSWHLDKTSKEHATGDVSYTISEFSSVVEEHPCYKCESGREGGRIFKTSKSFNVNQNGLSHESKVGEKDHADARIVLKFMENDTYTLSVNATTDMFTTNEKWKIEATGTCDNISPESKENERQITSFVNQIFGPYPGKAIDKTLSQSETKVLIDPISGERVTITLSFNLSRD